MAAVGEPIDGKIINDRIIRFYPGMSGAEREGLERTHWVQVETYPDGTFLRLEADETAVKVVACCTVDGDLTRYELAELNLDPLEVEDFFFDIFYRFKGKWVLDALRRKAKKGGRTIPGMVMELLKTALKPTQVPAISDGWFSFYERDDGSIVKLTSTFLKYAAKDLLEGNERDPPNHRINAAKAYLKHRWDQHFTKEPYAVEWTTFLERTRGNGYYGVWFDSSADAFRDVKAPFVHAIV